MLHLGFRVDQAAAILLGGKITAAHYGDLAAMVPVYSRIHICAQECRNELCSIVVAPNLPLPSVRNVGRVLLLGKSNVFVALCETGG